jgi:hypothetical protein
MVRVEWPMVSATGGACCFRNFRSPAWVPPSIILLITLTTGTGIGRRQVCFVNQGILKK